MARHPTYGERMAEWERSQDERYWCASLKEAISRSDRKQIEGLVKEGIEENYSFTPFDDPLVFELLDKFLH